jgi:hypothetical protein
MTALRAAHPVWVLRYLRESKLFDRDPLSQRTGGSPPFTPTFAFFGRQCATLALGALAAGFAFRKPKCAGKGRAARPIFSIGGGATAGPLTDGRIYRKTPRQFHSQNP